MTEPSIAVSRPLPSFATVDAVPSIREPFITSSRGRIAGWFGILILAVCRFIGSVHYYPGSKPVTMSEALRVGYNLYKFGCLCNPYRLLATGPTAHVPPLFPALVAGLYHIFGDGAAGTYAIQVSDALAIVGEVMLLPLVALAFGLDLAVGFVASLLAVLIIVPNPESQGSYGGLLAIVCAILACQYLRSIDTASAGVSRPHARSFHKPFFAGPWFLAFVTGLLWGILLLTDPSFGLVWAAWLALAAWHAYRLAQRASWLPALIVPVLMILPWTLRNERVLHSPVLIRSNLGLELMVSNNPCANYSFFNNLETGCFGSVHPNQSRAEAEKVMKLGEVAYNQAKLHEALAWIAANPGPFLKLTLQRTFSYWFPTPVMMEDGWGYHLFVGAMTVLSLAAFPVLWRASRAGFVLCLSFLLLYPSIYYFIQFDPRYRLPILWVTCFLAAIPIHQILCWFRSGRTLPLADALRMY